MQGTVYQMLLDNVLPPSESAKFVLENGNLVKINKNGVHEYSKKILEAVRDGSIEVSAFTAHSLHPKTADAEALQWVLLADTINFSFWPDEGKKYDVTYNGTSYTGYFAGCAAINKAIDASIPMLSADWMSKASLSEIDKIFKSDSGSSIPLVEERVKAINESGRKFDGQFINVVKAANGSAQKLLELIVENFISFRDFATFNGTRVSFLKRAQILVADVYGALEGKDEIGNFEDIGILTMFADYRVPQALAYVGVLEYSQELLDKLGEGKRLENGSSEEVQLRAASIAACDQIVEEINRLRQTDDQFAGLRAVPAMEVDVFTWVLRRQHAEEVEKKVPFHRTRCIYY